MTWVLGSALPFGYAALISDIRVTLRNGRYLDVLQKIYPVGSMMMAGFAGSVELGFAMIHDLQHYVYLEQPANFPEQRYMWRPQDACGRWHRRGRRIFSRAPEALKRLGCQLLVVGTAPFDSGLGPVTRCVRMVSPDFFPERIVGTWSSIGSGAQHESARHYAQNFVSKGGFQFLQGETMNPGGAASLTAMSVGLSLMREPMASVSSLLQVGRVTAREHVIEGETMISGEEHSTSDEQLNVRLARSFPEFLEICEQGDADSSAAQA